MPERKPFRSLARGFAVAGALGTGFAAAVAAGLWAGWKLDTAFGWPPLGFTVALGLGGGAAGFTFLVRTLRGLDRIERERRSERERTQR